MNITRIGVDLAKNVFQLHGVDEAGRVVLRKQLRRSQILSFFANLPACLIGMEACGCAHHWARELTALGHCVRLMAPQFVKPYVKTNKHDVADAEAICEAVSRPSMRFVAIKTVDQQAALSLHRARQALVKAATIGDAKQFANGRQLAAWIGLVPKQSSTGGRTQLLGISKRGDSYLRTLLIHGARSVLRHLPSNSTPTARWLQKVLVRRNKNVAAVALANKNARVVWALLAHERSYSPAYVSVPPRHERAGITESAAPAAL